MFEGMDNDMPKGLEDRSPRGRARNAMGRAIAKKERNLARARKEIASRNEETGYLETDLKKRKKNNDQAVKDMKKMGSPMKNPHFGEEVEITEARGRPKKAGAKDFTIHPKTKEKLMHNNPEHMKKIELLQKNKVLEKPKVEAGQHIMNQLSKAKTSMLGGSKIHFTHGDSKEVSGTHAAKILTKYAGMKPNEKEDFQKFVGHSHENLIRCNMAINVGTFIVKNKVAETLPEVEAVVESEEAVSLPEVVQMEEGTVIHNGQPKKFNKKMSAYMIDMLTSEE
jgi:hypothetical protein